jgi:hypothetical protein
MVPVPVQYIAGFIERPVPPNIHVTVVVAIGFC